MEQEFNAKTIDAAVELGLKTLGVTREQVEIVELSKGGFLSKARVLIRVLEEPIAKAKGKRPGATPHTDKKELATYYVEGDPITQTAIDAVSKKAKEFLTCTLQKMNLPATVTAKETETETVLEIEGDAPHALLSGHGEAIDALQYLTSLVANADASVYRRIVIDSADYRAVRESRLQGIAEMAVRKALERKYRFKLDPMNPYERRVIHAYLADKEGVTTRSEGTEPNRYVVIIPDGVGEKAKTWEPRENNSSSYGDRPPRNQRGGYGSNREYGDRNNRSGSGQRSGYGDRDNRSGDRDSRSNDRNSRFGDRDRSGGYGSRDGGNRRDRGGYGGRDNRSGGYDRPPAAPRQKPTVFGTIITPKTPENEHPNETNE